MLILGAVGLQIRPSMIFLVLHYKCLYSIRRALEELKRQGMLIREGDVGLWHEAFQEQYRSETSPLKVELVNLLDEKTKRFH